MLPPVWILFHGRHRSSGVRSDLIAHGEEEATKRRVAAMRVTHGKIIDRQAVFVAFIGPDCHLVGDRLGYERQKRARRNYKSRAAVTAIMCEVENVEVLGLINKLHPHRLHLGFGDEVLQSEDGTTAGTFLAGWLLHVVAPRPLSQDPIPASLDRIGLFSTSFELTR